MRGPLLEVVDGIPIYAKPKSAIRHRAGDRVLYEGKVHRVERITSTGIVLVPEERTFHETVIRNRRVTKDVRGRTLSYKVPLDEPVVRSLPDPIAPVTVSLTASLERVS